MDESEELVYGYLKWRGFKSIKFEPEGKSTFPDFLIDGRIAVEARRLNQNHVPKQPGMKIKGLEEQRKPIWNNVRETLLSLGPPIEGVSWYVDFQFERPAPAKRPLKRAIRRSLGAFRNNEGTSPMTITLFENFSLTLFRAGKLYSHRFIMAGCEDRDSGGWVIPELERNLQICIDEKAEKLETFRITYPDKHPEWWLVFSDHISYGTKPEESLRLQRHNWDKIILVDPMDHTRAFEV